MNEVFEKILERLRETKDKNTKVALDDAQKERCFWYKQAMDKAISIVREVAEEYNNDQINLLAMMYAKNLVLYGVDITKIWDTATQQAAALNQAYMRGRQDERGRFEEYKGGWIPCDIKMPEERDSMFAKLKGTSKWSNAMFEKASDVVNVTVVDDKGKRVTTHAYTIDGKWCCGLLKMNKTYRIVAWRPYPEPFQEIEVNSNDD